MVTGAARPRPLDAYAGEYQHPGYGTLTITVAGDALKPRLGTMDLSLAHRHYETFDLAWHELGDQSHLFPLMFLSDPDGDITALTVPFEPAVEPLRFDRLPDAQARDPEVLRRLCGTYALGPIEVTVALAGDWLLTITAPGAPPFELVPGRGLRFEVKGQPGITAEFELDETGAVARAAWHSRSASSTPRPERPRRRLAGHQRAFSGGTGCGGRPSRAASRSSSWSTRCRRISS